MSEIKKECYYTAKHEWLKIENGQVAIGITDYAQTSLGDIVFLELKEQGTELKSGDPAGTIESVKSAEDIYSPLNGIIAETNQVAVDQPDSINRAPYETWLIKLKQFDEDAVKTLMSSDDYAKYLETLEN